MATASSKTAGKTAAKSTTKTPAKSAAKTTAKSVSRAAPAAVKKAKGLGRGLSALLGNDINVIEDLSRDEKKGPELPSSVPLNQIRAGKYQPRTQMDETALNELAESIRSQGIMQPILIRPIAGDQPEKYEIIAGERRFRAAKLAGLAEVPVLVREVADENAAVMALIENIQREDLNPLEEAQGVKRLIDDFQFTHEQAAQAIGRSRSLTSNLLRLLNLAQPVQNFLLQGQLDMGHARALLAVDSATQIILANQVVARQLSVRETERLVNSAGQSKAQSKPKAVNRDVERLEEALSDHLGTRVSLKMGSKDKGQLMIDFHGWEHLNSLLEKQGLNNILEN
jgi:ParB family chromosome partitioning protein